MNKEIYALKVLDAVSNNSTCNYYKVGAVILKNGRIISTGWNGVPSNQLQCNEAEFIIDFYKELKRKKIINIFSDFDIEKLSSKMLDINLYVKLLDVKEIFSKYYGVDKNLDILLDNLKDERYENFIHSRYEVHAEQNAISFAARNGIALEDSEMFTTYLPCMECSKIIIQSGIKTVYYLKDYIDKRFNTSSIDFLIKSNVEVIKIKERS